VRYKNRTSVVYIELTQHQVLNSSNTTYRLTDEHVLLPRAVDHDFDATSSHGSIVSLQCLLYRKPICDQRLHINTPRREQFQSTRVPRLTATLLYKLKVLM